MALARNTVLSTVSLVAVRSLGVAARALGLLTLAAGMPPAQFGHYALAFILSELARCGTDFGLDPVLLRRAEGLPEAEQRPMLRAALAVRSTHGIAAAALVLAILSLSYSIDLLLVAAGLQFLSQGILQLSLNWKQINNSAHKVAPFIMVFYFVVISISVVAYYKPSLGWLSLPTLLVGELMIGTAILLPVGQLRLRDLRAGYKQLVPQALPMASVMLLAFINSRTDSLLVGSLINPEEAGHYLYLSRWVELAPMLATGLALPIVGKIGGAALRRHLPHLCAFGAALAIAPFVLVQIGAALNPDYASDALLRILLASMSALRIGLAVTTVVLLSRWRDRTLARLAVVTTVALPILVYALGTRFGAHGMAIGVIVAEAANLLCQLVLLLGRPPTLRSATTGSPNDRMA